MTDTMKRIFLFLFAAICAANSLRAYDFQSGDLCYNIINDTVAPYEVEVTYEYRSYAYSFTTATIPASVVHNGKTYAVTSIGDEAFDGCYRLTSITIPESVTNIGYNAFLNCTSFASVTIPESVTSIGSFAFCNCMSLTSIVVESGNSVYDSRNNCNAIIETATNTLLVGCQNTIIFNDVICIAPYAFCNCKRLTSVTIPENVMSIGGYAFYACTGLTSVTIGNSVTSIGDYAFYDCSALTSITIPESVTSIGEAAFYACIGLTTSITIPESVESIGGGAFAECYNLAEVHIKGVATIGDEAFRGCTGLTKLVCDEAVSVSASDSKGLLAGLSRLDTLVTSAQVFDVEEVNWAVQPKNIRYIKVNDGELTDNAFNVILRNYKTLNYLDIEGTTNTTLSDKAFQECYNLRTLVLPAQLTLIPYKAVADCQLLQTITIPATVTEIDNSAFENCRSIRSIVFGSETAPAGAGQYAPAANGSALWRIGNWAFYNCHELQHLDIPEGVTEIGDGAFYGCVYLEDMVLPASVQTIGDNTFALCAKVQKITVNALTPPTIQAKTFYDVNRRIPVYVPEEAVADYKADDLWKEFSIIGYDAPSSIGNTQVQADGSAQKIIRDGQVLIQRNDKTYTLTGQETR